jgi:hypothetical protein
VPVTSVLTLEKIATIEIERGPQPICGIGSGRFRAQGMAGDLEVVLERRYVELDSERPVDNVAFALVQHEVVSAEHATEVMERHVDVVLGLRRRRVRPKGETDLFARSPMSVAQQVQQQLARPCELPCRARDLAAVENDREPPKRSHLQRDA